MVASYFIVFSLNHGKPAFDNLYINIYMGVLGELIAQVWRQRFWMMSYGSRTPKRSLLWSNSKRVGTFRTGTLRRRRLGVKRPPLVKRYEDGSGKKRFSGIRKNLKKSGNHALFQQSCHPILCGVFVWWWYLLMVICWYKCLSRFRAYPLGFALKYLKRFEYLKKEKCQVRCEQAKAWCQPRGMGRVITCYTVSSVSLKHSSSL